nr:hypothetical protein [Tanacetum cinerariifolium]
MLEEDDFESRRMTSNRGRFEWKGHVQPINYDKLKALYSQFVPQKELSREQVYWQSPADVSTPTTPIKPFVKTRPAPSQEIWDSLELFMKGSGKTLKRRKEDMFDEYERFCANGNESIQAYFIRFHKLVNDMKVTQIDLPKHQLNTKFVNNLPAYWSKYVTYTKNVMI